MSDENILMFALRQDHFPLKIKHGLPRSAVHPNEASVVKIGLVHMST